MVELSVVSKLLQQLLSNYNRVSLPGLGAFKMEYTPAAFINGGKGMTPPSKQIYFSSAEIWNDGFLENAFAKEQGCSLEEAKQQLAEFGEQTLQSLTNGQRIAFPNLGILRQTDDKEYHFEAEKNQQLTPDAFGLLEIEMPQPITTTEPLPVYTPITPLVITPSVQTPKERTYVEEPSYTKERSYWWLWTLAVVVVVAVCGYIFRKPIQTVVEKMYYDEYYDTFLKEYKQ